MLKLGRPLDPVPWDERLRWALYRRPEWVPIVDDREDPDIWIERELENLDKEAPGIMAKGDGPLERECGLRYFREP